MGVISYSPLGGGFLTGRYTEDEAPDSKRAETTKTRYYKERNFRIVDVLKEIAKNLDVSVPQIALAWVLAQDSVTAPIVGANSAKQLKENIGALEISLSKDDMDRLNEVSSWEEMDFEAR
jgi:aryl-alcohol dehydrogenase-like predicted oxidoreductase